MCDSGVEIVWLAADYCTQGALTVAGAHVTNLYNPIETSDVGECGEMYLCVQQGQSVSFSVTAPNFYEGVGAQIIADQNAQVPASMFLYCEDATELIPPQFHLNITNAQIGFILSYPCAADSTPEVCYPECPIAGWHLWLEDEQGNMVDAGVAYNSGSVLQLADSTFSEGAGIFFNIDPHVQNVQMLGVYQGDGGNDCVDVGSSWPYQFGGIIPIQSSVVSYALYGISP